MPRPSVFAALRQLRGPMLLRVFRILNFTFTNMVFFFDCSRTGNFLEFSVTHFSLFQDDVTLVNYLIAIWMTVLHDARSFIEKDIKFEAALEIRKTPLLEI